MALLLAGSASAKEPDQVTMGLEDFLDLYEQTKNRPDKPEVAPRGYSLSSVGYEGEVIIEEDEPVSALFKAKVRIETHKEKGWLRIPLLSGSVALEGATIGGKAAPIVLDRGFYALVTDKKGSFDVNLTFAVNVTTQSGSSNFAFPLVPTGSTAVKLAVPADDALDFTVANARRQSDRVVGKMRIVEATLPSQGNLSVRWQREIPEDEGENVDARIYSEVYTLVGLGDGLLKAQATVQNTILFAGVDELEVQIPDGMTVLDVKGRGLRDWTVSDAGVMTASLNYAAENLYTLNIEMEKVVGEGSTEVSAPLVTPLGVQRSKGWMGVEARGNLEISAGEVKNASPLDVRALPAVIVGRTSQPILLGYKYLGTDTVIPLKVAQHADVDVLVTLLDQADATTMFTADGRRLSSVRYEVRNNRRQFLRIQLPKEAELWSASVAGRAVQPAASGGAILVPLVRSSASGGSLSSFDVEVVYVESGEGPSDSGKGTFSAQLPKVDVPTTYVAWTVYAPTAAKIKRSSIEGSLRTVDILSRPLGGQDVLSFSAENNRQVQTASNQASDGGLGTGAAPVKVRLPLEGQPMFFEKILVLEEGLEVSFDYKGLGS